LLIFIIMYAASTGNIFLTVNKRHHKTFNKQEENKYRVLFILEGFSCWCLLLARFVWEGIKEGLYLAYFWTHSQEFNLFTNVTPLRVMTERFLSLFKNVT